MHAQIGKSADTSDTTLQFAPRDVDFKAFIPDTTGAAFLTYSTALAAAVATFLAF